VTKSQPDGEIELLSVDRGPGMRDLAASQVDGHSTSGSPGTGMGAVRRLSDSFDIFSDTRGSVVMARLRAGRRETRAAPFIVAAVSLPKSGETVCGDAWYVRYESGDLQAMIADGLGHGAHAAEAARAAVSAFAGGTHRGEVDALQEMHDQMRHTRGAAAAVATIHRQTGVIGYAGVGNISALVVHNGSVRHAVSHSGTLGHEARVLREYSYPWPAGAIFVMHSDGLGTHWSLDDYRGLRQRHPAIIAAVLYRDHSRGRDDVTVLVAREAL
jgi:hypothetical protein